MSQIVETSLVKQETALIGHTVTEQLVIKNVKLAEQNEIEKRKKNQEKSIFEYLNYKLPYVISKVEDIQLIPERDLTLILARAKRNSGLLAIIYGGSMLLTVGMFCDWFLPYLLSNTDPPTLAGKIRALIGLFSFWTLLITLPSFEIHIKKYFSLKNYSDEKKISGKERVE